MNQIEIVNKLRMNFSVGHSCGRRWSIPAVGLFGDRPILLIDTSSNIDVLPRSMDFQDIGEVYVQALSLSEGCTLAQAVNAWNLMNPGHISDVMMVADASLPMAEAAAALRAASETQKATIALQEEMLGETRRMIDSILEGLAQEKAFHAELNAFLAEFNK